MDTFFVFPLSLVFFLPFVSHKTYFQGNSLLNPIEGDGQPLFLLGARLLFSPAQIRRLGKGIFFLLPRLNYSQIYRWQSKIGFTEEKKKLSYLRTILSVLLRIKNIDRNKTMIPLDQKLKSIDLKHFYITPCNLSEDFNIQI